MRTLVVVVALMLLAGTADARTRIRVTPAAVIEHPYALTFAMSYVLCAFHVLAVGPAGPYGDCVWRLKLIPPGRPR